MAQNLNNPINRAGGPVDDRTEVQHETDIDSLESTYVGQLVHVRDNDKFFRIKSVDVLGSPTSREVVAYTEITSDKIASWDGKQDAISSTNTLSPNNIKDTNMNGKLAAYDNNGVLGNSGIDTTNVAVKSEMSITDGTGADAGTATIQLKSGTSKKVLTEHQSLEGKVDKVPGKGLSTNDYDNTEKGKVANAIQMPSGATSDKVLGYENNAVAWVDRPSNGKSAYQIWYEENEYDDHTTYNEDYFLASLKAKFGSFVPAEYGTDGKPNDGSTDITASADTTNHIYLVDDDPGTPTEKIMWITVVDETDPQTPTYTWTNIGHVQVNLKFGSNQELNNVNIKDANGNVVTSSADVLSADAGNNLKTHISLLTCSTVQAVSAKTITGANVSNYTLINGGSMKIKFSQKTTVSNVTLNINNTGAKPLYYNGEQASGTNSWNVGETLEVYYDGENYQAYSLPKKPKFASGEEVSNVTISSQLDNTNKIPTNKVVNGVDSLVNVMTSKNLYTKSWTVDLNGAITLPSHYHGTDYIPIDKIAGARTNGIKILEGACGISSTYYGVAFFDENKIFINGLNTSYGIATSDTIPASSIPASAKYVILSRYMQGNPTLVLDNFGFDTIFKKLENVPEEPIVIEDSLDSTSIANALSANQGNVILNKLKNNWSVIDTAALTTIPLVIGLSNGTYKWVRSGSSTLNSQYRHIMIKCHAGDKFYIKANSSYDCSYAWLTNYGTNSDYDTEVTTFVQDTTLYSITKCTSSFIQAPEGAEFLYIKRTMQSSTELLPELLMREATYREQNLVPITLKNIIFDEATSKFVADSVNNSVVRFIKVKDGEKIRFSVNYNGGSNARTIYIGFSQHLPKVGGDATCLNLTKSFAYVVRMDDYYVAPDDGYLFISNNEGDSRFRDYNFYTVLEQADSMNPLRDEKIVVFGDSILEFKEFGYSHDKAYSKGFVEYLSDYTGAVTIRGAIGGSRLTQSRSGSDAENQAWNLLSISNIIHAWVNDDWDDIDTIFNDPPTPEIGSKQYVIEGLKQIKPSEVTMIVMDGGGNDWGENSLSFGVSSDGDIFSANPNPQTIFGAINQIMHDLYTANPYLKVFWIYYCVSYATPTGSTALASRTSSNWIDNRDPKVFDNESYSISQYWNKLIEHVNKWGVPSISFRQLNINPINFSEFYLDTDNTHPYKGFYRMARRVASQIIALMC